MSTLAALLPPSYGWVVIAGVATWWLNVWQTMLVEQARKDAGIAYPQLYAEKAEAEKSPAAFKFNCTQRAHQNTLETLPHVFSSMLFASFEYPTFAASLVGIWVIGRVLYTLGYATGVPEKRNSRGGYISMIALMALGGTATYTAVEAFRGLLEKHTGFRL